MPQRFTSFAEGSDIGPIAPPRATQMTDSAID
jgi:hypothetical protein